MHPRQHSPQLPMPAHATGHIWQPTQLCHPKICFALLPWLTELVGVCRSQDSQQPTLSACSDADSTRCPGVCLTLQPPQSMDAFTARSSGCE